MYLFRKKHHLYVVSFCVCFSSNLSFAFEFHPGVGVAAAYTDNARKTPDNKISDVVTTGIVEASIAEVEGPLVYDAIASLRKESYVNDTFEDQQYFSLFANANWEMLRDRFNWFLSDNFTQRTINALDANTPENRQDTNIFNFGANINFPLTVSQTFSVVPKYSRHYFEQSKVSNRQYSLAAKWNYQMYRLTNVGLSLNARTVEYDDKSVSDATYTTIDFIVSGQRAYSNYTVILGATNVKRDAAENPDGSEDSSKDTGFSGSANWQAELSSRSAMEALVLTEITDTTKLTQIDAPGNPNDVQQTTDVIRNSIIRLTYIREDEVLNTNIFGEYRKIRYADLTNLSRLIQTFGAKLNFPVTQQVSSGVFVNFVNTKLVESLREDKKFNVGTSVNVAFSRRLNGLFDIKYTTKESTDPGSGQNYDEFSASIRLDYVF